jgi:hypothetical protein
MMKKVGKNEILHHPHCHCGASMESCVRKSEREGGREKIIIKFNFEIIERRIIWEKDVALA